MSGPYRFAPAALARVAEYRLAGQVLTGDGWSLDLSGVTKAAFVNHAIRGARMIRLDLWDGDTRRSVSFTGDARSWRQAGDAPDFLRLLRDVLGALNPGLRIVLGERGRSRLAFFTLGLAALLGGVGLFALALTSGVSGERLLAAALPMLLLAGIGGALAWAYSPWRTPPRATPTALARVIDGILTAPAQS